MKLINVTWGKLTMKPINITWGKSKAAEFTKKQTMRKYFESIT
jgi:hypothetical protein